MVNWREVIKNGPILCVGVTEFICIEDPSSSTGFSYADYTTNWEFSHCIQIPYYLDNDKYSLIPYQIIDWFEPKVLIEDEQNFCHRCNLYSDHWVDCPDHPDNKEVEEEEDTVPAILSPAAKCDIVANMVDKGLIGLAEGVELLGLKAFLDKHGSNHKCTCPNENFTANPIGCQCNGV